MDPLGERGLRRAIQCGLARVATIIDGVGDYEYLVTGKDAEAHHARGSATAPEGSTAAAADGVPRGSLAAELSDRFSHSVVRHYAPDRSTSGGAILGYGYTENNRREFRALSGMLTSVGVDVPVVNVCDLPALRRPGMHGPVARIVEEEALRYLEAREIVPLSLLTQVVKLGVSLDGALETLSHAGDAGSQVFLVANDHSAAPVAYAAAAELLGMRTVYMQHAEVSRIFPALSFDMSVLRNRRSLRVYEEIGSVRGETLVSARESQRWVAPAELSERRAALRSSPRVEVVVYPSSVVAEEPFLSLVERLVANPAVERVSVKPHPNSREPLPDVVARGAEILSEMPTAAHVAVCGNSTIQTELLALGCLVYLDDGLDRIRADALGLRAAGLVEAVPDDVGGLAFWSRGHEWPDAHYALLAELAPRLLTQENVCAALAVRPAMLRLAEWASGRRLGSREAADAARELERLLREPTTCREAASAREGFWSDDTRVLAALAGTSAEFRRVLCEDHGPPVSTCDSVLDLWLLDLLEARSGRAVSPALGRQVGRFVRGYAGPKEARRWAARTSLRLRRRALVPWLVRPRTQADDVG